MQPETHQVLPKEFSLRIKPYVLAADLDLYEAYAVTSTNDWAWEHYDAAKDKMGLRAGLFLAETQYNGRGKFHRRWHSPAGSGVYCSLLYPVNHNGFSIHNMPSGFVPLYTGLATLASWIVLSSIYPSLTQILRVRGVNDLYANHAKVGGIIVETRMTTEGTLRGIVTGIGINLIQDDRLQILDDRNSPISLEELINPYEKTHMLNRKQTAYLIGKCTVGLYNMFHQGVLLDYVNILDLIQGSNI
ncbi:MAG: hypothetical protein HEQ32_04175 [Vampirovibrio sp.]